MASSPAHTIANVTALTAWVSYDSRRPAGAYIATDSRIAFTRGGVWDEAQKAFASSRYPDVFGYVGDVLFPALFLSRHLAALDAEALVPVGSPLDVRQAVLASALDAALDTYPRTHQFPFTIVHLGREGNGREAYYALHVLSLSHTGLDQRVLTSLDTSGVLELGSAVARSLNDPYLDGAGEVDVSRALETWNRSPHAHTSRAVFSAHCDALRSPSMETVGGPPQLVGLYRVGPGRHFGVHADGTPSLFGSLHHGAITLPHVEFRNDLFERVDAHGQLLQGAKRHSR